MPLIGLVIALLALANVMMLTNWHATLLDHDDIAADSMAVAHRHHHHDTEEDHSSVGSFNGQQGPGAIDLHALTHAMIHGLVGLVPSVTVTIPLCKAATDWFAGRNFALSAILPEALLRPPRI